MATGAPANIVIPRPEGTYLRDLAAGAYGDVSVWSLGVLEFARKLFLNRRAGVKEAAILDGLQHPSVITKMYANYWPANVPTHNDQPYTFYIDLPLMKGDLYHYISDTRTVLSENRIRTWMRQLLSALKYIHEQGISHFDVKPGNCLLNNARNLFLADFGLARTLDPQQPITHPIGTFAYQPPEVYLQQPWTHAGDCWAAGVTMYYCMTGRYLFDQRTERTLTNAQQLNLLRPAITGPLPVIYCRKFQGSPELIAIVLDLLQHDPAQRLTAAGGLTRLTLPSYHEQMQTVESDLQHVQAERDQLVQREYQQGQELLAAQADLQQANTVGAQMQQHNTDLEAAKNEAAESYKKLAEAFTKINQLAETNAETAYQSSRKTVAVEEQLLQVRRRVAAEMEKSTNLEKVVKEGVEKGKELEERKKEVETQNKELAAELARIISERDVAQKRVTDYDKIASAVSTPLLAQMRDMMQMREEESKRHREDLESRLRAAENARTAAEVTTQELRVSLNSLSLLPRDTAATEATIPKATAARAAVFEAMARTVETLDGDGAGQQVEPANNNASSATLNNSLTDDELQMFLENCDKACETPVDVDGEPNQKVLRLGHSKVVPAREGACAYADDDDDGACASAAAADDEKCAPVGDAVGRRFHLPEEIQRGMQIADRLRMRGGEIENEATVRKAVQIANRVQRLIPITTRDPVEVANLQAILAHGHGHSWTNISKLVLALLISRGQKGSRFNSLFEQLADRAPSKFSTMRKTLFGFI